MKLKKKLITISAIYFLGVINTWAAPLTGNGSPIQPNPPQRPADNGTPIGNNAVQTGNDDAVNGSPLQSQAFQNNVTPLFVENHEETISGQDDQPFHGPILIDDLDDLDLLQKHLKEAGLRVMYIAFTDANSELVGRISGGGQSLIRFGRSIRHRSKRASDATSNLSQDNDTPLISNDSFLSPGFAISTSHQKNAAPQNVDENASYNQHESSNVSPTPGKVGVLDAFIPGKVQWQEEPIQSVLSTPAVHPPILVDDIGHSKTDPTPSDDLNRSLRTQIFIITTDADAATFASLKTWMRTYGGVGNPGTRFGRSVHAISKRSARSYKSYRNNILRHMRRIFRGKFNASSEKILRRIIRRKYYQRKGRRVMQFRFG